MQFSTLSVASMLLLAPQALGWRIQLFNKPNYEGTEVTYGGPGGTGSACFSIGTLNNEVQSIHYYYENTDKTTKCTVYLYDSPGCVVKSGDWQPYKISSDYQNPNAKGMYWYQDVSSFSTDCHPA